MPWGAYVTRAPNVGLINYGSIIPLSMASHNAIPAHLPKETKCWIIWMPITNVKFGPHLRDGQPCLFGLVSCGDSFVARQEHPTIMEEDL